MTPGKQLINLVFIDDVVKAYIVACNRLLSGVNKKSETFAVSADSTIHLKKLVLIYSEIIQKKIPVIWGGINYKDREVMKPWSRGNKLPGWSPQVKLIEGIKIMEGLTTK